MTATVYRRPAEATEDYPGLHIHDSTVTGSIRCGGRLPLWAIITTAIHHDWDQVEEGWAPTECYGYTADDLASFLYDLLEQRGEFGRLLCVLADVERHTRTDAIDYVPWWKRDDLRERMVSQLRACLDMIENPA
jgi:hypothetical protein